LPVGQRAAGKDTLGEAGVETAMLMRMLLVLIAVLAVTPAWSKGSLMIVGGGLSADNAEIYRTFIDRAKGGKIAIIPSASGEPQASLDAFSANLVRYGVEPSRILQVKIAEVDDPATIVNESAWASNGDNLAEIAKIEQANAIWFTGGDQARTYRVLTDSGDDRAMLTAMRKRLAAGAVIGGTSAGAAIMGSGMIVCGDPARASEPVSRNPSDCAAQEGRSEPLVLGSGLGFLQGYVVDQHFSQRARLPRLLRATICGAGRGIGVDEDTAISVDLGTSRAWVIGRGSVTVMENKRRIASCDGRSAMFELGVFGSGEKFRLLK
jgi:cyanophycinase